MTKPSIHLLKATWKQDDSGAEVEMVIHFKYIPIFLNEPARVDFLQATADGAVALGDVFDVERQKAVDAWASEYLDSDEGFSEAIELAEDARERA